MWTLHTDSGNNVYGGQSVKNIYLGDTRIVTKLNSGDEPTYNEEYYKQYYYHSDHLGSASLITDYKGDEYQRIEYTPYGETWVEKTQNTGLEYLPYRFTGKEIDEETGLYYYGARYLDPRYSRWISTDPALGEYIPSAGKATASDAGSLPGMGGVFNTVNLQLYHYAGNNPIRFTDPDGRAQNVAQKIATSALKFISNHSKTARTFIKEHTSIQIQRSVDDNGQNGKYFQSKASISFCGIPLNTIDVQSTADWKSQVDAGKGGTIDVGTYTGTLLNKSGSYENAISITGNNVKESDAVLCHPNVKTALGETEEYGSGIWNNDFVYSLTDYEKAYILTISNENCNKRFYALKSDFCLILYDCETNECIFTGASISFNQTEGLFFPSFISATSELREGSKVYTVQNLSNFKLDSPWCEASEDYGIGEKIRLSINARNLIIISGYVSAKKPYLFENNSRPKIITISFLKSKIQKEFELKDSPNPQIINLDGLYNEEIEIVIKDVYLGKKYKDTCISTIFSMYLN